MAVRRRVSPLILFGLPLFILACGGSDAPARESVASSSTPAAPTAAPARTATLEPSAELLEADGDRIYASVRHLAETIGPRPTGTAREAAAAEYISAQLRDAGYEVELQEFPIASEVGRASSLSARGSAARTVPTVPFQYSGSASVRALLVWSGLGNVDDFPSAARGAVVLIERGDITFVEKVANAVAAGAAGVVIFNNEAGTFYGSLQQGVSIPVVSISQNEGRLLQSSLAAGPVEVELSVSAVEGTVSHNVVARPPGRECETVTGGHYDSVIQAPGASDNASGTATVIEIATVLAQRGQMSGNCFVLFGAEEIGLVGSRHFVTALDATGRERLKAMLNLDMVGVGDQGWLLIGSDDLTGKGAGVASSLGIATSIGRLPRNASSDHASFLAAGIPALFLYRLDDPLLHTPQDVVGRVRPEFLEEAARLGVAFLESLNAGG